MQFKEDILKSLGNESILFLEDKKNFISHSLIQKIEKRKHQLSSQGLGPGHKLVLCLPNSELLCEYLLAGLALGICLVPLSSQSTENEIKEILNRLQPSLVVFSGGKEEKILTPTMTSKEDAFILFTSGSSGKPKGVILTQKALAHKLILYQENLPQSFERTLCMLPLNFGHGLISNFLFPLLAGNQVILAPSGQMEIYTSLGSLVDDFGITSFSSVPSILKIASHFGESPKKKTLKDVFCASANLDLATWSAATNWLDGIRLHNMYGMTELASWVAGDLKSTQGYKESTFDLPWNAEVKMAEETGEIWIKSDSLMSGYYNDPEATKKVLENGWFKTGDVGEISSEHIILKGRADNVINLGGIKIYPEEINRVIRSHPDVMDCYTLGLKSADGLTDQAIGCLVVPKNSSFKVVSLEEICRHHLSAYKVPGQFLVSDKVPVNQRGKPDHGAVKLLFQAKRN
nr:acyl--CoA ligase [Bacteriovorax sp. HI3]